MKITARTAFLTSITGEMIRIPKLNLPNMSHASQDAGPSFREQLSCTYEFVRPTRGLTPTRGAGLTSSAHMPLFFSPHKLTF